MPHPKDGEWEALDEKIRQLAVEELQRSLGDSLIEDIRRETLKELAQISHDALISALDGPASTTEELFENAAQEVLSHPEIAKVISNPDFAEVLKEAVLAAI